MVDMNFNIELCLAIISTIIVEAAVGSQNLDIKRQYNYSVINSHHNITLLLDSLLNGYDNNLRPNFGGPPIVVEIDFNVRSMGPISEVDMTFSMDCYFRQTWIDKRLEFTGAIETMTLGISTLEKIWKPDTYFLNGRQSYLHTITVPNRFIRIDQHGRVLYSQRLTVKASCPMNLANFPIDTQRCPLELGSFAYSIKDVIYRWNALRRVVIAADMKMSQFDLISSPSKNDTTLLRNEYSTLSVNFYLQRHTGYFLIQVYAPCMLLVVLSWVAFWINREATADRVALGVTTVLTMTFLGLDNRNDLPKVSYATALDSFMGISFAFVFSTIIQFALVHYFTKRGSGEVYLMSSESSEDELDYNSMDEVIEGESNVNSSVENHSNEANVLFLNEGDTTVSRNESSVKCHTVLRVSDRKYTYFRCPDCNRAYTITARENSAYDNNEYKTDDMMWTQDSLHIASKRLGPFAACLRALGLYHHQLGCDNSGAPRKKNNLYKVASKGPQRSTPQSELGFKYRRPTKNYEEFNSVSKIDSISRLLFPVSFFVINFVYWYIYLSQNSLNKYELVR